MVQTVDLGLLSCTYPLESALISAESPAPNTIADTQRGLSTPFLEEMETGGVKTPEAALVQAIAENGYGGGDPSGTSASPFVLCSPGELLCVFQA